MCLEEMFFLKPFLSAFLSLQLSSKHFLNLPTIKVSFCLNCWSKYPCQLQGIKGLQND